MLTITQLRNELSEDLPAFAVLRIFESGTPIEIQINSDALITELDRCIKAGEGDYATRFHQDFFGRLHLQP